jgi:hypothetical protein
LVVHADNARPRAAKVTRAFCKDNFLRIAPHPLHLRSSPDLIPSDFCFVSCLGSSKFASKDTNARLQMNFVRESGNLWTKSASTLWKPFSGSESTDWDDAWQQMESARNGMKETMVRSVNFDSAQI